MAKAVFGNLDPGEDQGRDLRPIPTPPPHPFTCMAPACWHRPGFCLALHGLRVWQCGTCAAQLVPWP
eukprot:9101400-Alexandrium_andersonii.AAC.1